MSVPFEKELENVAIEANFCNCAELRDSPLRRCEHQALYHVLEEYLLPLLQAGQAMRDAALGTDFDRLASAWDAARERLAQLEKR